MNNTRNIEDLVHRWAAIAYRPVVLSKPLFSRIFLISITVFFFFLSTVLLSSSSVSVNRLGISIIIINDSCNGFANSLYRCINCYTSYSIGRIQLFIIIIYISIFNRLNFWDVYKKLEKKKEEADMSKDENNNDNKVLKRKKFFFFDILYCNLLCFLIF